MPTIKQTRISNLEILINEYGSVKKLADAVGRAQSVISQLRGGRSFGEKIARHMEQELSLPVGWFDSGQNEVSSQIDILLDNLRAAFEKSKISANEKALLDIYRSLSKQQQSLVLKLASEIRDSDS